MKELKTVDSKEDFKMGENMEDFIFYHNGIVYQDILTLPTSDYYPIKPKGRQMFNQAWGNLKVPSHGIS